MASEGTERTVTVAIDADTDAFKVALREARVEVEALTEALTAANAQMDKLRQMDAPKANITGTLRREAFGV